MSQATSIEGLRKHLRDGPKVLKKSNMLTYWDEFYLHLAIKNCKIYFN